MARTRGTRHPSIYTTTLIFYYSVLEQLIMFMTWHPVFSDVSPGFFIIVMQNSRAKRILQSILLILQIEVIKLGIFLICGVPSQVYLLSFQITFTVFRGHYKNTQQITLGTFNFKEKICPNNFQPNHIGIKDQIANQ